ncbi:hypothetical protein R3P38DRAFT_3201495 [Favolaschia claudopus]|uniref:Uncharacterized protein n=1 Tax=Favolaschia claudopus TaxID=2862362 RepID=A0AAW0AXN9_9AGAR
MSTNLTATTMPPPLALIIMGAAINHVLEQTLSSACVVCRLRGSPVWDQHIRDDCQGSVATIFDTQHVVWKTRAFDLPTGWCFFCYRPQGYQGFHEATPVSPRNCLYKGHIQAALYTFWTRAECIAPPSSCPLIPAHLQGRTLTEFSEWAQGDAHGISHHKFKKFLVVFYWLLRSAGFLSAEYILSDEILQQFV